MVMASSARRLVADATGYWWVLLVSGGFWILFSLAILQFDLRSVWSIAILTGIVLLLAGMTELAVAFITLRLKWAHFLLAVFFLIGGIVAFAWPGETFLVLSRLIGWYLLFLGTFEIIESLSSPRHELWWLRLILGAATVGVAFWAAQSLERSATLLILWVGLGALFRGVNQILLAFQFRDVHETAKSAAGRSGPPGQPQADGTGRPVTPTGL